MSAPSSVSGGIFAAPSKYFQKYLNSVLTLCLYALFIFYLSTRFPLLQFSIHMIIAHIFLTHRKSINVSSSYSYMYA